MAKKLSAKEAKFSRPVVHDIFEAGGLLKHSVRTEGTNYIINRGLEAAARNICNEIKTRDFKFHTLDSALEAIAERCYFYNLHVRYDSSTLKATQIANILAAFCAEQEIFWDDVNTLRTAVEMETYRKSLLGNACWNFKCFLSQNISKSKTTTRSAATRTIDPTTGKAVPKSGYKSSGPKSGLIKGLIGEPGEKVFLPSGTNAYVIRCGSTKAKKQYVFVDPLTYVADPNKIRLGDPSGYSACKLFFGSIAEAQNAIDKIESGAVKVPVDISGFEIVKQPVDTNGYFILATEIGPAYVKASKLNEAISGDLDEAIIDDVKTTSRFPEINDIDTYTEAMLHHE